MFRSAGSNMYDNLNTFFVSFQRLNLLIPGCRLAKIRNSLIAEAE
ncbi:hypothetical protein C723_0703 [Christiangramia flava JLT2011]|uniref:Uncharacterized protein n=1 Tax=Christiangramia flava JLT2011 TaxID=1229726 RepID=A0A1L7I3Z4_9FLAO|nr:hypothetical protein GRFL_1169 [Christiangramia flava JLT2011]OSS40395.1 hypothetical protein C723_0703 [Christiangramia flava JLT2011]